MTRSGPARAKPSVGRVCDTPVACLCSSSGEECCCLTGERRCRACGATIVTIDVNTGEEIVN